MTSCAWWHEGWSRSCGSRRFVARVGGDEFGVLLQDHGTQLDSDHVARLVCATLEQPFAIGSASLAVSRPSPSAGHGPGATGGRTRPAATICCAMPAWP